ncbi:S9 family peptidase [Massilia sp. B-10]|nr:S9 family peptidase [Massilia sp. B-10]
MRASGPADIPRDVNVGLAYALANFPLDPDRVAGMGTSFGGYLTMHLAAAKHAPALRRHRFGIDGHRQVRGPAL